MKKIFTLFRGAYNKWTVSPNPTDGNITINTIVQQNKKFVFEVSNAEGKIILRETVELTKGQNKININLKKQSNITAGVYFIKAVGLETNNVKKIMVQ